MRVNVHTPNFLSFRQHTQTHTLALLFTAAVIVLCVCVPFVLWSHLRLFSYEFFPPGRWLSASHGRFYFLGRQLANCKGVQITYNFFYNTLIPYTFCFSSTFSPSSWASCYLYSALRYGELPVLLREWALRLLPPGYSERLHMWVCTREYEYVCAQCNYNFLAWQRRAKTNYIFNQVKSSYDVFDFGFQVDLFLALLSVPTIGWG